MSGVIYRILCTESGKSYIGSAKNPQSRWAQHRALLRRGEHHSTHLQRAFAKHGGAAFRFEIVEEVEDDVFLLSREQFWLWRNQDKLYNACLSAGSPLGVRHSLATRAKHARRMKGNRLRQGQSMSEEAKARISKSLCSNQRRRGKSHSDAAKQSISEGLKKAYREGRRPPPDGVSSVKNLSAWNAKIQAGLVDHPAMKAERNRALLAAHAETRSLSETAKRFGITPSAVWAIVNKYNQSQLSKRSKTL